MSCRIFFKSRLLPITSQCLRSPSTQLNRAPGSFLVLHRSFSTQLSAGLKHTNKSAYNGPLAQTFRRLKIFSLSSLMLSSSLAPFMFLMESNIPTAARVVVAFIAVGTSGLSTGLVGWCAKPYVATLRRLVPEKDNGSEGIEMTTFNMLLRPRVTRVYDPIFLIETKRPFAKWELAEKMTLPDSKYAAPSLEETVAETTDKDGTTIGRWVVRWGENGEGTCHEVGSIVRHFNVHEELLH